MNFDLFVSRDKLGDDFLIISMRRETHLFLVLRTKSAREQSSERENEMIMSCKMMIAMMNKMMNKFQRRPPVASVFSFASCCCCSRSESLFFFFIISFFTSLQSVIVVLKPNGIFDSMLVMVHLYSGLSCTSVAAEIMAMIIMARLNFLPLLFVREHVALVCLLCCQQMSGRCVVAKKKTI